MAAQWDWLIDYLVTPLRDLLWGEIGPALTGPLDALLHPFWGVRDAGMEIRDKLTNIPGLITGALLHPLFGVRDKIANAPGLITGALVQPLFGMRDKLANIPGLMTGALVHPLFGMRDKIANIPGLITGALVHPLFGMRDKLGSLIPLLQAIPAALIAAGTSYAMLDRGAREEAQNRLVEQVLGLGDWALDQAGKKLAGPIPGALQSFGGMITGLLEQGLSGVQNLVLGQGQITPERANEIAVRAFLTTSGLGATAHLIATLVELIHPMRYIGLHYLSGFVAELGGFSAVSSAIMGTMMRVGVGQPMQHYLWARTRPSLPTSADLQAMVRKHNITPAEFGEGMAYWGYDPDWIARYLEYLPADPRLFEILRLAETGIPDTEPPAAAIPLLQRIGIQYAGNRDWWLEMKMALAGYNWIDIPKLVQTIRYRMTNSERTRLISAASVNFRNGYMTESDFRAELSAAGKAPEQIEWKVRAERLSALRDDINDLVHLYTDQFLKDILTEGDLRVALVNVGVTPRKSDILAARAAIRKMPKPTDPTKAAEEKALRAFQTKASQLYKEQYKANLITAEEYRQSLRSIGIRDNVAWVTVEIEATKKVAQTRKVAIKEEARAETRVQRARERLYREQFRTGQIDSDLYYYRLVEAGTLPDEARATVALEATRRDAELRELRDAEATAAALRTRSAYERLARARYRTGMIGAPEYQSLLESVGVPPREAAAIVATEVTRSLAELEEAEARVAEQTARAARRLQETLARERFRSGEIGEDRYLNELLEAGTSPALARATVELETWKLYDLARRAELKAEEKEALALQRRQADLLIRRYHAGNITAATLLDNLVAIGVPELIATATVELEVQERFEDAARVLSQLIVPAIKAPWEIYVKELKSDLAAGEITAAQYLDELIGSGLAEHVARLIIEVT